MGVRGRKSASLRYLSIIICRTLAHCSIYHGLMVRHRFIIIADNNYKGTKDTNIGFLVKTMFSGIYVMNVLLDTHIFLWFVNIDIL